MGYVTEKELFIIKMEGVMMENGNKIRCKEKGSYIINQEK
jgi:hypothetical protein